MTVCKEISNFSTKKLEFMNFYLMINISNGYPLETECVHMHYD